MKLLTIEFALEFLFEYLIVFAIEFKLLSGYCCDLLLIVEADVLEPVLRSID